MSAVGHLPSSREAFNLLQRVAGVVFPVPYLARRWRRPRKAHHCNARVGKRLPRVPSLKVAAGSRNWAVAGHGDLDEHQAELLLSRLSGIRSHLDELLVPLVPSAGVRSVVIAYLAEDMTELCWVWDRIVDGLGRRRNGLSVPPGISGPVARHTTFKVWATLAYLIYCDAHLTAEPVGGASFCRAMKARYDDLGCRPLSWTAAELDAMLTDLYNRPWYGAADGKTQVAVVYGCHTWRKLDAQRSALQQSGSLGLLLSS